MKEDKHIRIYQQVVIIASSLIILFLFLAWIISGPGQEWRKIQRGYKDLGSQISDSIQGDLYSRDNMGLQQYELEGLHRIDRCITCHVGIEDPSMDRTKQPFTSHPEGYFEKHPPDEFGCTICHGGQGRAVGSGDAHGGQGVHWEYPLLSQPYLQSSCGKCHLSIFNESERFAGTEIFTKGQEIFKREGCIGCHKARGVGGILGPDLSEQGEKTIKEYNFGNITSEQTVPNWLKEHFRDPEMVSPGSRMLKIDLPEEDLDALTTFVLGLAKPEIDFEYFSIEALNEFKGRRNRLEAEKIFSMACSACHGKDGSGKSYETYKTGVPAILMEDFLRLASLNYIEFSILKGRSQRQMASWDTDISGLKSDELNSISVFMKNSSRSRAEDFNITKLRNADAAAGKLSYAENCATCHGPDGIGGVALALNRSDLLKNADDKYLYNTLIRGRGNATMPSWSNLPAEELNDLLKYLRSFQQFIPPSVKMDLSIADTVEGRLNYHFMCSRCHGEFGEGQTGPSIINADFLELASNEFLYNTIAAGREHTAMFGWSKDVYNAERLNLHDIGNIISFMRKEAEKRPDYIYAGANPGNREAGAKLFIQSCAKCHGQEGEGIKAPALNNQELLNAASNGYLLATITIGRSTTDMPAWGMESPGHPALSGKDRLDIVAFIRGWERIRIAY